MDLLGLRECSEFLVQFFSYEYNLAAPTCNLNAEMCRHPLCPTNPRGGYSHIWAIRVCAAQQGMVFASLTLEQGIKITLFSLEQGIFFRFDSGIVSNFP